MAITSQFRPMPPAAKRSPENTTTTAPLPRGAHSLSRAQVNANQRLRIVLAMIAVVGEKGYAKSTIVDVAARAGVSRKTFYEHFPTRQECFLASYDAILAEGIRKVAGAYHKAEGWPGRVEAAIRTLFETAIENPAATRLALIEIAATGAAGIERREHALAQFEGFIRDGLELAPGAGTVPDTTLRAVVGGLNKVLYTHVRDGQHSKLLKLIPDLVNWATSYYPAPATILEQRLSDADDAGRGCVCGASHAHDGAMVGGRAPGTLFPKASSNGRRGLALHAHNISPSFVIHSQRERILDAVANLSAATGYTALTVEEIVGEAAVSLEAFYKHFTSKEDAFLVAYELGHVKGLGIVERAFAAESDWRQGVRAAILALLHYLAAEPAFAHLALLDALIATPRCAERADKGLAAYTQMLLPGFSLSPKHRHPPPPAITIEAITGGLSELCINYALQNRIQQLPQLSTDATYIALAPFIGGEEAARVAIGINAAG
jgi:AcrR family transcriptional regulator